MDLKLLSSLKSRTSQSMSSSRGDHELHSLSQVDNDLVRHKSTTPTNPAQTAAARPASSSASASQAPNDLAKLKTPAQTAVRAKLMNPRRGDHVLQKHLNLSRVYVTRPEGFRGTHVLGSKDYTYVEKVCGAKYDGTARLRMLHAHFIQEREHTSTQGNAISTQRNATSIPGKEARECSL